MSKRSLQVINWSIQKDNVPTSKGKRLDKDGKSKKIRQYQ